MPTKPFQLFREIFIGSREMYIIDLEQSQILHFFKCLSFQIYIFRYMKIEDETLHFFRTLAK
jgi:hypothetical protein